MSTVPPVCSPTTRQSPVNSPFTEPAPSVAQTPPHLLFFETLLSAAVFQACRVASQPDVTLPPLPALTPVALWWTPLPGSPLPNLLLPMLATPQAHRLCHPSPAPPTTRGTSASAPDALRRIPPCQILTEVSFNILNCVLIYVGVCVCVHVCVCTCACVCTSVCVCSMIIRPHKVSR